MSAKSIVVSDDGEPFEVLDYDDHCHAYEPGDLCGGCPRCMMMQAEHCGHRLVPVDSDEGTVLLDVMMERGMLRGESDG